MEKTAQTGETSPMNHEALFDQAVKLAYETFDDPSDAHITGVYAVLAWGNQRGLDLAQVTIH